MPSFFCLNQNFTCYERFILRGPDIGPFCLSVGCGSVFIPRMLRQDQTVISILEQLKPELQPRQQHEIMTAITILRSKESYEPSMLYNQVLYIASCQLYQYLAATDRGAWPEYWHKLEPLQKRDEIHTLAATIAKDFEISYPASLTPADFNKVLDQFIDENIKRL